MTNLSENTPLQDYIKNKIKEKPNCVRYPAFNAIRSLDFSQKIQKIDPPMAGFRLTLAEEEAVAAIFQSLKRRNYTNASKLDKRSHIQKNSLIPFISIVTQSMSESFKGININYICSTKNFTKPINISVDFSLSGEKKKQSVIPDMPFNLQLTVDGQIYHFEDAINKSIKKAGHKSVEKYIQREANFRNKLLYASDNNAPGGINNFNTYYLKKKDQVYMLLSIALMIDDYNKVQPFAQQCLNAFLKMHKKITLPKTTKN